jgi:hypothetical protein
MAVYSFADVQRLTGAERGHLARWAERGVITPDLGGGGVSGAHRKFSFRNVFEIGLAVELQRFHVDHRFIKEVLTRLRVLDPDTVRTADVPVNRAAFRAQFDGLSFAQRRKKVAAINKSWQAHQGKSPGGPSGTFDPDSLINALTDQLTALDDTDARRWNRFKRQHTRGYMRAFIVVELLDHGSSGVWPQVSFVSSLDVIEKAASERAALVDVDPKYNRSEYPTAIVIDARSVLVRLERDTGDSL